MNILPRKRERFSFRYRNRKMDSLEFYLFRWCAVLCCLLLLVQTADSITCNGKTIEMKCQSFDNTVEKCLAEEGSWIVNATPKYNKRWYVNCHFYNGSVDTFTGSGSAFGYYDNVLWSYGNCMEIFVVCLHKKETTYVSDTLPTFKITGHPSTDIRTSHILEPTTEASEQNLTSTAATLLTSDVTSCLLCTTSADKLQNQSVGMEEHDHEPESVPVAAIVVPVVIIAVAAGVGAFCVLRKRYVQKRQCKRNDQTRNPSTKEIDMDKIEYTNDYMALQKPSDPDHNYSVIQGNRTTEYVNENVNNQGPTREITRTYDTCSENLCMEGNISNSNTTYQNEKSPSAGYNNCNVYENAFSPRTIKRDNDSYLHVII